MVKSGEKWGKVVIIVVKIGKKWRKLDKGS